MSDSADRTMPATPRRREAARRQGAFPASSAPAWAATALTAVALAPAWGRATVAAATAMLREAIATAADPTIAPGIIPPLAVVLPTVGLVTAAAGAGLAVRFLCDGWSWVPARALPDVGRLDLRAGLARVFSFDTVATVLGSAASLVALAAAAWWSAGPLLGVLTAPQAATEGTVAAAWRVVAGVVGATVVVAGGQWAIARLRFERRIRMTPQEFADESKSMQADPKVRFGMLRRRPRQSVAGTV